MVEGEEEAAAPSEPTDAFWLFYISHAIEPYDPKLDRRVARFLLSSYLSRNKTSGLWNPFAPSSSPALHS